MDELLSVEKLQLFLMFVVPGFVAIKVYDLFVPSGHRAASDTIVEAVTYSMVNLALMCWAMVLLIWYRVPEEHPVWYGVVTFVVLFVSPAILGAATWKLRTWGRLHRFIQHPMPTAWDFFFSKRPSCWVLFHLTDGKTVGGRFGCESYATSYPEEAEVYVEEAWRIDDHGRFSEVAGTRGMIVRRSECQAIEFFKANGG